MEGKRVHGQFHEMNYPPRALQLALRDADHPVRLLELVRPFMSILPEVTAPERKVR